MPAVKNTGIKRAIKEFEEGKRDAVSEYTMTSQEGNKFIATRKSFADIVGLNRKVYSSNDIT